MSLNSFLDPTDRSSEHGPVMIKFHGTVTLSIILDSLRSRWEKGFWHRPVFIDARESRISLSNQDIEEAAHVVSTIAPLPPSPPARTAVWVTDPLSYGLGRVYMSFGTASDRGFSVFYKKELALAWVSEVM